MESPDRYHEILCALALAETDRAHVARYNAHEAQLLLPNGAFVHVFRYGGMDENALLDRMRAVAKTAQKPGIELVLAGGPASARQLVKRAKPRLQWVPTGGTHLDDDGGVTQFKAGARSPLRDAIDRLRSPVTVQDRALLDQVIGEDIKSVGASMVEAETFAHAMAQRRPIATWVLAAVIGIVFGLEIWFGGSTSPPTLMRMGALHPATVRDGEWWRLMSASFLHGGPMHFGFNVVVLLLLGNFLERLLGTGRFLLLYSASALGGGVAGFFFLGERFSVGASGALWGLLAADAVLAYVRADLLPAAIVARARSAALTNLAINVANSFRPEVDMAAHFGGGAVGALLMITGVLTFGLTRATDARPQPAPAWIRGGAGILTLALGVALVAALITGRPWTLVGPLERVRHNLSRLEISVEVPSMLDRSFAESSPQGAGVGFGKLPRDPAIIEIASSLLAVGPEDEAGNAQVIDELTTALKKAPSSASKLLAGPKVDRHDGATLVVVRYRYENGVTQDRVMRSMGGRLVQVDAYYAEDQASRWHPVARQIILTAEPLLTGGMGLR